jgi:hypothetical protein
MPTIVAPQDRKLAFRRRVRLNKAETAALNAFLDLYESAEAVLGMRDAKELKGHDKLPEGVKYLGSGVDKSAFALPGGRYVVKVPARFARRKDADWVSRQITKEARIYTSASEELKSVLAMAREERGYCTVQERAKGTLWEVTQAERDRDVRAKLAAGADRCRTLARELRIGDLHEMNIAVRFDGSVCIIDYSR